MVFVAIEICYRFFACTHKFQSAQPLTLGKHFIKIDLELAEVFEKFLKSINLLKYSSPCIPNYSST
jgi:hypothetical protein